MNEINELKFFVIDVDGVLTDAGIYYDCEGNELKKFCTKDAAGFFAAKVAGIKIIVLTGRECKATERRLKEMKVDCLVQNVKEKEGWLRAYMTENQIDRKELGYIGDDLNDLSAMKLAGWIACPLDSCKEILDIADYISPVIGGRGVVRDVMEHIFRERGMWEDILRKLYGVGV